MDRWTFYFGELHAHTGYSWDGGSNDLGNCPNMDCGVFEDFFTIARVDAGLDFCAITDHVGGANGLDAFAWAETVALVNDYHDPAGGFITLLAGELNISSIDAGHKNLYFFGDEAVLSPVLLSEVTAISHPNDCGQLWTDVAALEAQYGDVLLIPHHPATFMPEGTDWDCHDSTYSPAVEMYSSHGNSRDDPALDPYDPLVLGSVLGSTVNVALSPLGYDLRLGILGGTDFHDTSPGMVCHLDALHANQPFGGSLTGMFADTGDPLNRGEIHDAITERHTFATTGPKIPVMVRLLDSWGDELALMGEEMGPVPVDPVVAEVTFPDNFVVHPANGEVAPG